MFGTDGFNTPARDREAARGYDHDTKQGEINVYRDMYFNRLCSGSCGELAVNAAARKGNVGDGAHTNSTA